MNSRRFFILTVCLCVLALSMSLYVWQLRKRAASESMLPASQQAVTPPDTESTKQVTLWIAHDDPGVLRPQDVSIALSAERQRRARQILRALLATYTGANSPHPMPAGAEVRNVYFVDPGLVVVDLNSELTDEQTSGIFSEELTVSSLVQTLSANFQGISRVQFLVNGNPRETLAGHADLSSPYDVSQIAEFVKQLSPQ